MTDKEQMEVAEPVSSSPEDLHSFFNHVFKMDHVDGAGDGVLYFETVYLALKENQDYLALLKTLAILDVQRIKVSQDIQKLHALKLRVKEDPESVKNEILAKQAEYLHRINVCKVPDVDMTKYKDAGFIGEPKMKQTTNDVNREQTEGMNTDNESSVKVKGRIINEKKTEIANQVWSLDEQLRLEQLLIKHPPEVAEIKRWKKIAQALGTRTAKQVRFRVQKYFQKLNKAGISTRNISAASKKKPPRKKSKASQRKQATFSPEYVDELESDSEDDNVLVKYNESTSLLHWQKILEKINHEKKMKDEGVTFPEHIAYKCSFCNGSPIIGTVWNCTSCAEFNSCSDCLAALTGQQPPNHPLSHTFQPVMDFSNPNYSASIRLA